MKRLNVFKNGALMLEADCADGFFTRLRGLMWKSPIERGLLLEPCADIHTFFMREPIDVVFLSGDGTVLRIIGAMGKNRMSGRVPGAKAVLELPSGEAGELAITVSDRITVERKEG